jgi:hypothetical protein
MTTAYMDPDAAVDDLGTHMKSLGWTWQRQRAGLGWATKRLGEDRRKKVILTARVGVKGRRDRWANGELNVQFYKVELASGVEWDFDGVARTPQTDPLYQLAQQLVHEFTEAHKNAYLEVTFSSNGLAVENLKLAKDWLITHSARWVTDGLQLATQVEFLHEEQAKAPWERCVMLRG